MAQEIEVLQVEDYDAFADLSADSLTRQNPLFRVTTCSTAAEALDYLKTQQVDCIVSAYLLPDADGIELLQSVRNDHPEIPFILFTTRESMEIISEALAQDVTEILKKGQTEQFPLLAHRIEQAVDRYRLKNETVPPTGIQSH